MDGDRLAALPPVRTVPAGRVREALVGTPTVVVLDDDPTGTQTIRDLPVLTRWTADDVDWALAQGAPAFFVLTNTRSLAPDAAAARNREVVRACLEAAGRRGVAVIFASRSDSTLRGHFPLETDVIAAETGADAVVLAPAYTDAGRVTLDGVHWLRDGDALTPVAESEFAADASFGYRSSRLADWVAEKSGGAIPAGDVVEVGIASLRAGPVTLPRGRVIVLDAVVDDDLRAGVLAVLDAEREGARFVYRVGPSFVRARVGQAEQPPIGDAELAEAVGSGHGYTGHGLVVVGSHVARTSRQLERLGARRDLARVEIDVPRVLAADVEHLGDGHLDDVVASVTASLEHRTTVLSTSRTLVTGRDEAESLDIARRVSAALTGVVGRVVGASPPTYVLAKGGITSSDVATGSLRADRAWVRGSLLPGIVSLWAPASGPPLVVFAGNVGGEEALADVVDRLEEAACA